MDAEFNIKVLKGFNRVLLASNALLFVLIAAHWVVQIIRSQRAFIDTVGDVGDAASAYYAFPADYMNLIKEIYRVWIVYDKRHYVIVVPALLMVAFSSAFGALVAFGKTTEGGTIFASSTNAWAITVFVTTVSINIMTTSLIVARVWRIKRKVKGVAVQSGGLATVLHVIIESAALYTATALFTLIGYTTKNNWQFITIDMLSPIIGISFTLISVRLSHRTQSQAGYSMHDHPSLNVVRIHGVDVDGHREAIGLETIAINVTQHISKHTDLEDNLHGSVGDESASKNKPKTTPLIL
ncbi:hypothetical protein F5890DRAFT_1611443 [Lentinula detonsa]|uniref:Uncharacterized protein n=1 Tax=Lentinula detonsa TaxID=2804962 RepID=A0AA38PTZ5_9AGAR|nr:hypothetical protein F5890DRAFT_1611443 [Lentinula detonsa]